jgi:hypothetical protein
MSASLNYKALLIGNATFEDPALPQLHGPPRDVRLLLDALVHPERGLHDLADVRSLVDRRCAELLVEIEQFFCRARKDDQLLLYYSGHGKSWNHVLYMCASDTRTSLLVSTAVSAQTIDEIIKSSPSSRIVLILDCCHSGLVARGKGGTRPAELEIPEVLRGHGRYVLASTRGAELAADGVSASPFTRFLVEGLLSDAADVNQDGFVTVDEVYDYLCPRVMEVSRQRPQRAVDDAVAKLALARRPSSPDTTTARRLAGAQRVRRSDHQIKCDGVYQASHRFRLYYMRFYADGSMIWTCTNSDPVEIKRWFDRTGSTTGKITVGTYEATDNQLVIQLQETIRDANGATTVTGVVHGDAIMLKVGSTYQKYQHVDWGD